MTAGPSNIVNISTVELGCSIKAAEFIDLLTTRDDDECCLLQQDSTLRWRYRTEFTCTHR